MDFIKIVEEGDHIAAPMPLDNTIVEVRLKDGSVCRALHLRSDGDSDFYRVIDGKPAEDIYSLVVAWRRLAPE